jgi:hypothetical protein
LGPTAHACGAGVASCGGMAEDRRREEEGELSVLMRGMMNAQANDNGWPTFSGKFVEYPRFRKEW